MNGITCPYCGARHLDPITGWHQRAAILAGAAGSAMVVIRIIARSSPVLASALLVGGAVGLLWGTSVIGEKADAMGPQRFRCHACGKEYGH